MASLLTLARAKQGITGYGTFSSPDDDTLNGLCTAVSDAVRNACGTDLSQTSHTEIRDGSGTDVLQLDHCPVLSVTRVATGLTALLTVTNTSALNQRATASVNTTGLSLRRVASGVVTDSALAFATYVTAGTLAAAVTALGNGWSGTAVSAYTNWASADLAAIQGAGNAKNCRAELRAHVEDLTGFDVDAERGWIILGPTADDALFTGNTGRAWTRGRNRYRVDYSAGYATVPDPVQEACAQWIAMLFFQTKRDPGLVQSSTVSVGSIITYVNRYPMPQAVRGLLAPYMRKRLGRG